MLVIILNFILQGSVHGVTQEFPDCGIRYEVNRYEPVISHGLRTALSEYPWHVALYRQYSISEVPEYICGGSIIHERIILTAAHCIYNETYWDIDKANFTAIAGKYYSSWEHAEKTEQRRKVIKINILSTYVGIKNRYADDISLLTLNDSLIFSSIIMPVCIDWSSEFKASQISTYGTVVGWGLTENGSMSSELLVAKFKYYNFTICRKTTHNFFSEFITSDKFCAGLENGTAVQPGDSGGGFVYPQNNSHHKEKYFIYGIVSTKDKWRDNIAAFTDLEVHLHWLNKTFRSIINATNLDEGMCEVLTSPNVITKCYIADIETNCGKSVKKDTKMIIECKDGYHKNFFNKFCLETVCLGNGQWKPKPQDDCTVCGRRYSLEDYVPLISDAKETNGPEYPWHAGLYKHLPNETMYLCGGSIIHTRAILTGAHCVYNETTRSKVNSNYSVVVGKFHPSWEIEDRHEQRLKVKEAYIPDYYVGNENRYEQDIAVLELENDIQFNSVVNPICLDWKKQLHLKSTALGTFVGWGMTEEDKLSDGLRVAEFPWYNFYQCREITNKQLQTYITPDKFCAGVENGSIVQQGDNGGGLVFPFPASDNSSVYYLYGILSLKEAGGTIGVYTKVNDFLDWIKNILTSITKDVDGCKT